MKRVVTAGSVLALLVVLWAAPLAAQERSERLGEVRIDARLHPDGALEVSEARGFVYSGTFDGARYEVPLADGQEVADFSLRDDQGTVYTPGQCSADGAREAGAYELDPQGFSVTWCYPQPVGDTTVTMLLDYTVLGAGTRHADASQLYWQWIGEAQETTIEQVVAEVALPTDEFEFWAHGPLTGAVERVGPDAVRLEAPSVPASTFVELRVLMPADALADTPSDGREIREDIVAEERCLAVAADAERARARGEEPAEDCDPDAWMRPWGTGLAVAFTAVGGGLWLALFRRHGKEYALPAGLADYERELPSADPPALVDWLVNWGSTSDKALVATIMDLARQKKISIRREARTRERFLRSDTEQEVTVLARLAPADLPWEREVQDLLFEQAAGGRGEITDEELKKWVEDNREAAYSWWQEWTAAIAADAKAHDWIEPKIWVAVSALIGVLVVGAGVAAGFLGGNLIVAGLAVAAGVALAAASPLMRRRSQAGRVLHHRWQRFGAFLSDYSLIADRGPEYLALWGEWIVYAVPLGVADTVMRNLDARLSQVELEQASGGWYPVVGMAGGRGFSDGFASVAAAVPAAAIASSPQSSSGAGGGFSGGGGGGGGGSSSGSF